MSQRVVGFVGLGNMGIPMTRRLVAAGYRVRGFDSSAEAMRVFADTAGTAAGTGGGVTAVPALAQVGDGADAVILMLPDSDAVEQVLLGDDAAAGRPAGGLLAWLRAGTIVIDMSSSDPMRTRELAAKADAAGVTLIDAPVSGGVSGARNGTLTIMAGGPSAAVERITPVLAAIGSRVVRAGDSGAGHAVKALNNLMSAAHLLASSEALIAGRRFGLDPAIMLDIVNSASGRSGSTENKWPNYVLTEKYDAGFGLRLMVKDIRLALRITRETGVDAAASEAVAAAWEAALTDLPPDADHTAIAHWLSERRAAASSGDPHGETPALSIFAALSRAPPGPARAALHSSRTHIPARTGRECGHQLRKEGKPLHGGSQLGGPGQPDVLADHDLLRYLPYDHHGLRPGRGPHSNFLARIRSSQHEKLGSG